MSDAATPPEIDAPADEAVDGTFDGTTVDAAAADDAATDDAKRGAGSADGEEAVGHPVLSSTARNGDPAEAAATGAPVADHDDEAAADEAAEAADPDPAADDADTLDPADSDETETDTEEDTDTDTDTVPATRYPLSATGDRVVELAADGATDRAVGAVRDGDCIVLPTDTVYGIGADAFSASAVQRLLDAKGRGRDMPPPVLVAEPSVMMALATDVPDRAKDLASRFWPGALTLILKSQPSLMMDLGETGGTIAVRVPDHDELRELLRRTGPLAVSSANASGQPAATDIDDAREQLGQSVAVYLDGGAAGGDAPSTIVDFTRSEYGRVLRPGKISVERLREVIPFLEDAAPSGLAATRASAEDDAPEPAPHEPSDESAEQVVDPGPKHPFGAGFGKKSGSTAVAADRDTDTSSTDTSSTDDVDRLPDGTPADGTAVAEAGGTTIADDAAGTGATETADAVSTDAATGSPDGSTHTGGAPGA